MQGRRAVTLRGVDISFLLQEPSQGGNVLARSGIGDVAHAGKGCAGRDQNQQPTENQTRNQTSVPHLFYSRSVFASAYYKCLTASRFRCTVRLTNSLDKL